VLRNFWKTKPTEELEAPPSTPADLVAEAHLALKAAEILYYQASATKNAYLAKTLTYGWKIVNGVRCFQLDEDRTRKQLSLEAARAYDAFQRATQTWSELKLKFSANDAVHVAGQLLVRP
jgi:hypothetical protein